jgi:hypothetical protein
MLEVFSWIVSNLEAIGLAVGALLTLGAVVAGFTKSPDDDAFFAKLNGWLSFLTHKDAPGTFKPPFTAQPPPVEPPLMRERPSNVTSLRLDD